MSGPQFMHVETYACEVSKLRRKREVARAQQGKHMDRKLSVEEICKEAGRVAGHHPHVSAPKPPVVIFGVSPEQVPSMLAERVASANVNIREKKSRLPRGQRKGGPRAIRPDSHTALTFVASFPISWVDERTGSRLLDNPEHVALLKKWEALNLAWLLAQAELHGFELVSVVRHDDEGYPHLHAIGLPLNERMEARACHVGYVAKSAVIRDEGEDDKAYKRRQNAAYNNAMRSFQDCYFEKVGIDAGLIRLGPKRRRLTNAEYKDEKAAAKAVGLASLRADALLEQNQEGEIKSQELKALNDLITREVAETLVLQMNVDTEHRTLVSEIRTKKAEVADLGEVIERREAATRELAKERELLSETQAKREAIEAEIARKQAEHEQHQLLWALERQALDTLKREHEGEARRKQYELDMQQTILDEAQLEVATLVEGIEAFASGRLKFRPADPERPLALSGGYDSELVERFGKVKPKLVPILERLDRALTVRAEGLWTALTSAVSAWSEGILQGLEERQPDSPPTFIVADSKAGDTLMKLIDPFRETVAKVVATLPDLALVRSVKQTIERLRPHLSEAANEEVRILERDVAFLQHRGAEKGK